MLVKLKLWLVFISTIFGFYAAVVKNNFEMSNFTSSFLFCLTIGSIMCSAGVSAINQVIESKLDSLMDRTKKRPIASGKIPLKNGLYFGITLSILGTSLLFLFVEMIAGTLSIITAVLYLFVYTPLKQKTPLNTLVGAFPGALPPLGGWIAATGEFKLESWILFAVLFSWLIPHFLSIAWIYR